MTQFPECLQTLVKKPEDCKCFSIEFLDALDRHHEFDKYKKWKVSLHSQQTQLQLRLLRTTRGPISKVTVLEATR